MSRLTQSESQKSGSRNDKYWSKHISVILDGVQCGLTILNWIFTVFYSEYELFRSVVMIDQLLTRYARNNF